MKWILAARRSVEEQGKGVAVTCTLKAGESGEIAERAGASCVALSATPGGPNRSVVGCVGSHMQSRYIQNSATTTEGYVRSLAGITDHFRSRRWCSVGTSL